MLKGFLGIFKTFLNIPGGLLRILQVRPLRWGTPPRAAVVRHIARTQAAAWGSGAALQEIRSEVVLFALVAF